MKILKRDILTGKEKILVRKGESVNPKSCIAEVSREYSLLKILEVKKMFGIKNILKFNILKKQGNDVKKDEVIGIYQRPFWKKKIKSPLDGKIKLILKDEGIIVIENKKTFPNFIEVNIFSKLGTKNILWKKEKKEIVKKGEVIAEKVLHTEIAEICYFKSPFPAKIVHLDKESGDLKIVDIQYPVKIFSGVYGKIKEISSDEIVIQCEGEKIEGIVGIGKKVFGKLVKENKGEDNNIIFIDSLDREKFLEIKKRGKVKGIITCFSSMRYIIDEIPEDYPLGMGEKSFYPALIFIKDKDFYKIEKFYKYSTENPHAFINPFTQIRAGIVRPYIVLQNEKP